MRPFYKLLVANFRQFFRDKTTMFFTFAFPLLFMLIFGFVFSGEGDTSYNIGIVREDDSATGAAIAEAISRVPIFEITEGELDDLLARFEEGDFNGVILIPADIESRISRGEPTDITVYHDPSQTTASQVILSVMGDVISIADRQITGAPVLLQMTEESIQSNELGYIDYLVPGILAMSVLFLGLFGALPMVEWREKQVLKRFGATPVTRLHIISSQITYRLVLAVIQTLIIIAVAYFVFNVQMVGNWLLLFGLVVLGALTLVSIGYLAVARSRTVEGAMPLIQLIQFPMLFLSGIFFPIDFMPDFMRPIVSAIPLTYLADALRQVMVEATPAFSIATDIAVLVGWLVVTMALSVKFFRWE